MIAIYKETIGDGTLFNMDTTELIMTIKNGRINEEVERLRNENVKEKELIRSHTNSDICLVYDKYKLHVLKALID